jgi:hypothetical protein
VLENLLTGKKVLLEKLDELHIENLQEWSDILFLLPLFLVFGMVFWQGI